MHRCVALHRVLPRGHSKPEDATAPDRVPLVPKFASDIVRDETAENPQAPPRVVELRFFGGLSVEEVAAALDVSRRTVEGEWTHAKAWLGHELRGRGPGW